MACESLITIICSHWTVQPTLFLIIIFNSFSSPHFLPPLSEGQELVGDGDGGSGSEGGEWGDWTQSHVKGQRAASPQGAGSAHKGPGRDPAGAGGAAEEERPRWEPKLTAQTLLIH